MRHGFSAAGGLGLAILLFAQAGAFGQDETKKLLLGKWVAEKAKGTQTTALEFFADGKGTHERGDGEGGKLKGKMTYKLLSDDQLQLEFIALGNPVRFTNKIAVTGDALTVKDQFGETQKFKRVGKPK